MSGNSHMAIWQRWICLGLFIDAFAIYGVASVALRDGDRAMYVATTFFVVTGALLLLAFADARLEARNRRRRRPKPPLTASNWDRDEVVDFWA